MPSTDISIIHHVVTEGQLTGETQEIPSLTTFAHEKCLLSFNCYSEGQQNLFGQFQSLLVYLNNRDFNNLAHGWRLVSNQKPGKVW